MTTSLLLTLLLCVHLLTISKSQSLANYANLQIFRKTNTTLLATWDYNGDVSRSTLHISYATTASFIPGTLIGELVVANTSNLNQAMLHLPSIEQSPIVIVTHVRLSLSNDKHFIESSPWITTSQCGDGSHYLNDTTWDGELEPDVSRWTCNICPKNARCLGGISNTWHSVTAYFGTWRHNQADRGASNFSQCLAPRMCLGAPNKQLEGLYGLDPVTGIDVALLDNYTEGCDASKHAGGPLCSVCSNNTWRDSSFECIECSDRSMSIFLMILAFVFMIAVLVVAIAVTIFDEETPTAIDLQM